MLVTVNWQLSTFNFIFFYVPPSLKPGKMDTGAAWNRTGALGHLLEPAVNRLS
jgi:hypothetical protein